MGQPLGVSTSTPADNTPWGTGSTQVWVPGVGWQELTGELLSRNPGHWHYCQLWRLDDERTERMAARCFDGSCILDEHGLFGQPRTDARFLCGYCGQVATLATLYPTDGGKSAACPEHAARLEDAYMVDADARADAFDAELDRRTRRGRRRTAATPVQRRGPARHR